MRLIGLAAVLTLRLNMGTGTAIMTVTANVTLQHCKTLGLQQIVHRTAAADAQYSKPVTIRHHVLLVVLT